jgi:hypothetical protein
LEQLIGSDVRFVDGQVRIVEPAGWLGLGFAQTQQKKLKSQLDGKISRSSCFRVGFLPEKTSSAQSSTQATATDWQNPWSGIIVNEPTEAKCYRL